MINIEFKSEAIAELRLQRFDHPHPRVQLKMEALLLKSYNLSHEKICDILDISGNTLRLDIIIQVLKKGPENDQVKENLLKQAEETCTKLGKSFTKMYDQFEKQFKKT